MKTPRRIRIAGIGKYLPSQRVLSSDLEKQMKLEPGWIEHKTGVVERRYAQRESLSEMGAHAARSALKDAGVKLNEVDLIISASASPEQCIPCTAVFMQRALGPEAEGIPCFDVDGTCLSSVFGLEVASNLISTRAYQTVLLISAEKPSVALNHDEPESSVLMGDGAAAVVLRASKPEEPSLMYPAGFTTYSAGAEFARLQGGGGRFPPNQTHGTPEVNLFHMEGPRIFRMTQKMSVPFVQKYLSEVEWKAADLDAVVPHQASLFAVRMTARACGFEPEKLVENIQTHGNCLAASIPMALHDAVQSGQIRRGDRVLLAGTAAGISIGTVALHF